MAFIASHAGINDLMADLSRFILSNIWLLRLFGNLFTALIPTA
jgi:hypothetical protein